MGRRRRNKKSTKEDARRHLIESGWSVEYLEAVKKITEEILTTENKLRKKVHERLPIKGGERVVLVADEKTLAGKILDLRAERKRLDREEDVRRQACQKKQEEEVNL